MRIAVTLGAILAATAACGSAAATAGATCGPSGAKTLGSDRVARIYDVNGNVYGCADSSGHGYLLAADRPRPGQPRLGPFALAGIDVGYGETTSGVDTIAAQVIVRRLDDGRTLHDVAAVSRPPGAEYFESVSAIVVKADGAVAWIATAGSIIRHGTETEVDRVDRRGEARLDATSAGDIGRRLRLRASRLSWRHGGATRTATLL